MSKSKTFTKTPELDDLEARLSGTLRPVSAPKEFINRLREGIRIPPREEIASRLRDWKRLFFVFGGVISGMLVLITVARALYTLSGRRNM